LSTERDAIVARALEHFERARAAAGCETRTLALGGKVVRAAFAGPALVGRVWPALAHLAVDAERADLCVHLWDGESTGVGMVPSPWQPPVLGPGGHLPAAEEVGLSVYCRVETGMVTMLDAAAGIAFQWVPSVRALSRHDAAAPLRQILSAWFAGEARCLAHGAAVGLGGRGVLLGGRGGSGKSTTALVCLEAGFDYAGDDYVLVDCDAEGARVHGIYATGKVAASGLARVPGLSRAFDAPAAAPELPDSEPEKALAYLDGHAGGRLSRGFPLVALLLPQVAARTDTRLARVPSGAGLRGLAPSTVFQHGGGGGAILSTLARLAQRLPCYRLELGSDVAQIPRVIGDLIERDGALA
jgi:hypothetical protein